MRIAIEDIPMGVSNLQLTCGFEELGLKAEEVRFTGVVTVELDIFKHEDNVFVKAKSSVAIESECARCLSPVHQILEAFSDNQYQPLPKIVQYQLDDIGIRYYVEEYVDLSEDIRESLLLEVPARILCSENCEGICSHCGQNLNEGKCDCHLEPESTQASKFADLVKMLEIKGKLEV